MSDTNQFDSSLIGQRQLRLHKIAELRKLGIDPYPGKSSRSHTAKEITSNFANLENHSVTIAGRLMSWREHGKLAFGNLQDQSGQVQLYLKDDTLKPTDAATGNLGWEHLNLIDIGDYVEAKGTVTKTQRGEISVLVEELRILSKTIRPLPSQWHGISDVEERFRRRYLDMTMNPEVRERFERRATFWTAVRDFMNENGFVEVNIPVLEHVTGGADAKPFVTHYDALDQDFYLRISHELPLKRLIGAGFEKVYDLGPRFRNEGFSDEHLPEHVAMEWYWAYADYRDGMKLTQEMFQYVMQKTYGTLQFHIKGFDVNLAGDWGEIDFTTVIKEKFGVDIFTASVADMNAILQQNGVNLGEDINKSRVVDNLWKLIRKTIAGPVFLTGVPKFLSPLAKTSKEDPRLTYRFHPVIAGSELANAFGELNDPVDQLERFVEQQRMREAGDSEAHMLDIDYVEMLEYGMPPAVGFGMSERVFWFFEDVTAKEGVPFPQLKFDLDNTTRDIYAEIADLLPQAHKERAAANTLALPELDLSSRPEADLVEINAEVKEKLPGIKVGYLVLEGLNLTQKNEAIAPLSNSIIEEVTARYTNPVEIKNSKKLAGFRELYKAFGTDPKSKMNSAEALLKRVISGKGLYSINPLVDLYNAFSILNELPMAAYDLDKVVGNIQLRYATPGDSMVKIGEVEPTLTREGELVYADQEGVICLSLNYRDADRTKIEPTTSKAIVFMDGHAGVSDAEIHRALAQFAYAVEEYLGAKVIGQDIVA